MALQADTSHTDVHNFKCTSPTCGFRAGEDYFDAKRIFFPGVCPRTNCGANVQLIVRETGALSTTHKFDFTTRRVVPK